MIEQKQKVAMMDLLLKREEGRKHDQRYTH